MTIKKTVNGGATTLQIIGRLDTSTAPVLETAVDGCASGVNETVMEVFDITGFADVLTIE